MLLSYVNIKRPTFVVGQVYTKITIKPSVLDKRKISTYDSISAAIVSNDKIATVKNLKVSYTCT